MNCFYVHGRLIQKLWNCSIQYKICNHKPSSLYRYDIFIYRNFRSRPLFFDILKHTMWQYHQGGQKITDGFFWWGINVQCIWRKSISPIIKLTMISFLRLHRLGVWTAIRYNTCSSNGCRMMMVMTRNRECRIYPTDGDSLIINDL